MTDPPEIPDREFVEEVGAQARRKLAARRRPSRGLWFGLGMMGLIGWSVAVPTVLGAGLGLWLDREYPGGRSWTLALLVLGLALGCFNAWHWVAREEQALRESERDAGAEEPPGEEPASEERTEGTTS